MKTSHKKPGTARGWSIRLLATALVIAPGLSNPGFVRYFNSGLAYGQNTTTMTYTYDSNGNLLSRTTGTNTDTFVYDAENRLNSANIQLGANPGLIAYSYDDDGLRTATTVGGTTTTFLLDKNRAYAQVVLEQTGSTFANYAYGHRLISVTRTGLGSRFYLADGHLSTRQLVSPTGLLTDSYTYDAFGNLLAFTGTSLNNYRYAGEPIDSNSNLYYLRARYYDPVTGRFNATDPFDGRETEPLSMHRYLYADADPLNKIDPAGKFAVSLITIEVIGILLGVLDVLGAVHLKAKKSVQGSTDQFLLRICPGLQVNLGYGIGGSTAVIAEDPSSVQKNPTAMKYILFFHGASPGVGGAIDLGTSLIKFSTSTKDPFNNKVTRHLRRLEDFVGSGTFSQGIGGTLVLLGGSAHNNLVLPEGTFVNLGASFGPKLGLGFDVAAIQQVDWFQWDKQPLEAYRSGSGTLFCNAQEIPQSRPGYIP